MSARRLGRLAAVALTAALLGGCASADKHLTAHGSTNTATSGMNMDMGGSGVSQAPAVKGVKPVVIRTLATSYWQDMEIQAQTMTPTPFVTFNGSTETTHRPPQNASFHLMVMLTDRRTHFQIPYCSVWATIIDANGKTVYSDTQWPMISEYMGSHYGNNVPHLAPGRYTLKLLISPPQQARHLEYARDWLKQHTVSASFTWTPTK